MALYVSTYFRACKYNYSTRTVITSTPIMAMPPATMIGPVINIRSRANESERAKTSVNKRPVRSRHGRLSAFTRAPEYPIDQSVIPNRSIDYPESPNRLYPEFRHYSAGKYSIWRPTWVGFIRLILVGEFALLEGRRGKGRWGGEVRGRRDKRGR